MTDLADAPVPAQPVLGDSSTWGPEQQRTIHWHEPHGVAAVGLTLSGLDYLHAMADGRLPLPPIARLLDMRPVSATEGEVVFECTPDHSGYNPLGFVHGGVMCTLLDTAGGCAVHTTLPAGVGYTSIEIKVSYLRGVHAGVPLRAVGRVTKPGRRVAFAEAEILDPDGKLVASATTSCLIIGG
ncbi:MAG: PaaI family thioesterase [Solirubrobacteraceae bacterium]|nr:PaaI family thioesterase [Solirubrobacteraceae bacterium]